MTQVFGIQSKLGKLTLEQVPEKWRAAVKAALECEATECM